MAFDPSFEIDLPAELDRRTEGPVALRAFLGLPYQLRVQALRVMTFTASAALTRRDDMREASHYGVKRAARGYGLIADLLAGWNDYAGLHPDIIALCQDAMPHQAAVLTAIDRYRGEIDGVLRVMAAGDVPDAEQADRLMLTLYDPFHPAMLGFMAEMAAIGRTHRAVFEAAADGAQARALKSRERIDHIARTVRLISLNARVEAARAGEAGLAFGVIAREIKALSEETEAASAELAGSVDEIMTNFRAI
ncbi:MAG: methyl-accepting chemotaxis protein [Pseudomonadota bacterium]